MRSIEDHSNLKYPVLRLNIYSKMIKHRKWWKITGLEICKIPWDFRREFSNGLFQGISRYSRIGILSGLVENRTHERYVIRVHAVFNCD